MKKFTIEAMITVSAYTEVEAENVEEAIKIAEARTDMMSISSNNGDEPNTVWMIEELDGTPFNLHKD